MKQTKKTYTSQHKHTVFKRVKRKNNISHQYEWRIQTNAHRYKTTTFMSLCLFFLYVCCSFTIFQTIWPHFQNDFFFFEVSRVLAHSLSLSHSLSIFLPFFLSSFAVEWNTHTHTHIAHTAAFSFHSCYMLQNLVSGKMYQNKNGLAVRFSYYKYSSMYYGLYDKSRKTIGRDRVIKRKVDQYRESIYI